MKKYKPEKPVYSDSIDIVETTDTNHADNINAAPKQLMQNTVDNHNRIVEIEKIKMAIDEKDGGLNIIVKEED